VEDAVFISEADPSPLVNLAKTGQVYFLRELTNSKKKKNRRAKSKNKILYYLNADVSSASSSMKEVKRETIFIASHRSLIYIQNLF